MFFFQTHFQYVFDVVQQYKWHHRVPELKLHLIGTFFVEKFHFQNLTFSDLKVT